MYKQVINAINNGNFKDSHLVLNSAQSRLIAEKWSCEPFALPSWDSPFAMEGNLNLSANYFFFGNLINFGFDPRADSLGPVGCNAFWLSLRCHPELLNPSSLIHLTASEFTKIFGDLPFMHQRINLWHEAARTLRLKYNGEITELYEANHWNALEILRAMVSDFSGFQDTSAGIPFMRNALLTLFMTHARFQDSVLFSNLDHLWVGADVQVFNALLQLGVIDLDPELIQALAKGPIQVGYQETFLRCSIILAARALLVDINTLRTDKIDVVRLDQRLRQIATIGRTPLFLANSLVY